MDSLIVQRLKQVEGDLLDVVISDGAGLQKYAQDWSQLCLDIESAVISHQLQDATVQLAHTVTSRVHILSSSMLSLQEELDSMTARLEKELNDLFSAMSLNEQPIDTPCTSSLPLYVKPAYAWIMENLHNPYPPKHMKATISRESGCSIKDIDNWFINARRRIGWNRVRRVYFANKRQEITAAAACFFGKTSSRQALDSHIEMEFASIQNLAENLYNDKFMSGRSPSRPGSPKEVGDSDADGSTDCSAQPVMCDAKDICPTSSIKQSSPPVSGDPRVARKTKRHRDDLASHSCKAVKKRRIDDQEPISHRPPPNGTPLDNVFTESTKSPSSRKRRRLSLYETEKCTHPIELASNSHDRIVPNPSPVEALPSNFWPFDDVAFSSAFSAERISQDLSAPLEIEFFDPSRLFADFGPLAATSGVQDPGALHLGPVYHSSSIAGESSNHDTGSPPATSEESSLPDSSLSHVPAPPIPSQDLDWILSLFDEKTFNKAYSYDIHAFSLPFDFGLTAPC